MRNLMQCINKLGIFVGAVTIVVTAVGYVSALFEWGETWIFPWIRANVLYCWVIVFAAVGFTLWYRLRQLQLRFTIGFTDDFKGDLRRNWDFSGDWGIAEPETLLVTGSDQGGLTKTGTFWENYTFQFEAKIIDKCIGVVVRATGCDNYYMFQIRQDRIRPHRRITVPLILQEEREESESNTNSGTEMIQVVTRVGWQVFEEQAVEFAKSLQGWFRVKVTVRGESVCIYIDEELEFQKESFLKIPAGKVGFRNDGTERALVRKVRVFLE